MRGRLAQLLVCSVVLVVAALTGAVHAGEGVIEINQAAVLAGNITSGDTAGFPAELYAAGSYRLTSNLTVTDENTKAIFLGAANITIDLNGFAILGPVICMNTPVTTCTPSGGSGYGIGFEPAPAVGNVTVLNGTVRGMGQRGIRLGDSARIEGVRVIENALAGIQIGAGSTVDRSVSYRNGDFGIFVNGGQVTRTWSQGNKASGISVQGVGGLVVDCTSRDNGGIGLALQGGGYGSNVIENNLGGSVSGGNEIDGNVCNGNTTCP